MPDLPKEMKSNEPHLHRCKNLKSFGKEKETQKSLLRSTPVPDEDEESLNESTSSQNDHIEFLEMFAVVDSEALGSRISEQKW